MDELIARVIEFITNPGVMLFGAVTFIEVTPIKINPWSIILKWIGNVVNAEDRKNIEKLNASVDKVRENQGRMEDNLNDMKRKNEENRKYVEKLNDSIELIQENQARMEDNLNEMKHETEEDKAKEKRWHILDFVNSCRHGRTHTREEWNHVISELADYETFTERKGIKNGVIEEDAKYLRKLFQENNETNNFL